MKLTNITAIITGGASGLGWAVANYFLKHQAKVACLDLPKENYAEKVSALGKNALFCPADITQTDSVLEAIQTTQQQLGPIQVAVNCAGIASAGKIISKGKASPLEIFAKTMEVNLTGTFNVCRLVAESMAQNKPNQDGERGVLVNTASIAAFDGQKGQCAYAASKGGIAAMTLPMARDLSDHGIRVVTIAPGIFDTPMLAMLPEAARESLGKQVPFPKRLGLPEEYAALAAHIVENPMLNGEVIRLDGALRMGIQ